MTDDFPQNIAQPSSSLVTETITFEVIPATTQSWHHKENKPTETETTAQTSGSSAATGGTYYPDNPPPVWDRIGNGGHAGVIMAAIIGIVIIVIFSIWFCCNGCGVRKKNREATGENGDLPMHTMQNRGVEIGPPTANRDAEAPPSYEEVVPPQHQHLAGGMPIRHGIARGPMSDDDDAVVSDGKTPLSEIPFEDVVLDHSSSESSSSRTFDHRHHAGGGDTTGHTNS